MVEVNSLSKSFGKFQALDNIDLKIRPGQVFGLLGPNGAGKSTLIRTLMGFLSPTKGDARIAGFDCETESVRVHEAVSYLPGDARLYNLMKAKSVLSLYCQLRRSASFETGKAFADRFELDLNRWVGLMSTGMRQKLALSIAFSADVPLLILDEPTANLDPTVRGQVLDSVIEAKQKGRTVIFSSHVLSEIEQTCDRVGILRGGKLVHVESIAALNRQHRIQARLPVDHELSLPEHLEGRVDVKRNHDQVQFETTSDLSEIFQWLAAVPLSDVHIHPVGLRSVYDRFHFPESIHSSQEESA